MMVMCNDIIIEHGERRLELSITPVVMEHGNNKTEITPIQLFTYPMSSS